MRRNSFNTSSNPAREIGIFKGSVVSVGEDGLLRLKLPKLGLNNIYEGVPYAGPTPAAGDVVFVGFLEGKSGSFVAFTGVVDAGNTGNPAGDITSVVAGTNLNGGGTGRTVTLNLDDNITLSTVTATSVYANLFGPVHIEVKNTSGGTLAKGAAVYATGSVGASGAVEVQASDANNAATMPALGLLDEQLTNNAVGSATVAGVIRQVDTSAYSINDELYVSTTPGALTDTRPSGSSDLVQKIGRVVRTHATTGEILVLGAGRTNDIPNSFTTSGDVTVGGDLTVNGTVTATALAVTGEFTLPTADGTADQVLVTDGSGSVTWQDSSETTPGGSDGFVQYNNGGAFGGASSLYYDDVNNRLGIGTTSPDSLLEVANATEAKIILNDTGGTVGAATNSHVEFQAGGSEAGYVGFSNVGDGTMRLRNENGVLILETLSNDSLSLRTNSTTRLRVTGTGDVGIGELNPSYTLDVNGTGRFTGALDADTQINLGSALHLTEADVDGSMRVQGNTGYIDIGPKSATYCNIDTDRGSFYFNKDTLYANSTSNKIWHAGNDGPGSTLDADTVDGVQAASFLRSDQSDSSSGTISASSFGLGTVTLSNPGQRLRATTSYGYIDIGPQNTTYCHIYTDRAQFYLNQGINSAPYYYWRNSSGIGGPLTDTSSTSGYRYVLQNQTFGTFFDYTSVRDRKDQITNVTAEDSGRWIDALQPVTYIERWMGEGDEPDDAREWREADMQVGFIADDILDNSDTDHFSQALDNGEGGLDPAGWKWECVIAAAVAEIKALRTREAVLEARIAALEAQ